MTRFPHDPMVLYPATPLLFEVKRYVDVVGIVLVPMDFRRLVDLIRRAAHPDWCVLDARSTMYTFSGEIVTPEACAREMGIVPIDQIGEDLLLNGRDLSRLLADFQTYTMRAYDIEDSSADQTENLVKASSVRFNEADWPVLPSLNGASVFVSEGEERNMYVEANKAGLAMEIFRTLLAKMIEAAIDLSSKQTSALIKAVLGLSSMSTLKGVPLPGVDLAQQLLGTKEVFLADRKRATWQGYTITIPYSNQTHSQAHGDRRAATNLYDLPHFEPVGRVEYDVKTRRWHNTPTHP